MKLNRQKFLSYPGRFTMIAIGGIGSISLSSIPLCIKHRLGVYRPPKKMQSIFLKANDLGRRSLHSSCGPRTIIFISRFHGAYFRSDERSTFNYEPGITNGWDQTLSYSSYPFLSWTSWEDTSVDFMARLSLQAYYSKDLRYIFFFFISLDSLS